MSDRKLDIHQRRGFLKGALIAISAIPFLNVLGQYAWAADTKAPTGMKPVPAGDPVATALGYAENEGKIDFAKYPARKTPAKKNEFCDNCALYKKTTDTYGKCQMIATGDVYAKGWCAQWAKKA